MSILDQSAAAGGSFLDPIASLIKNPFQKKVGTNGLQPPDFPNGFVVTEYMNGLPQDGTGGRTDTRLQLVGNMMPMQPFNWDSEQRLSKQYYPGNPEPAVHVLGGKQGDLVIHGRFKDKRYKDKALYGVSYQLSKLADAICKRGNLVKFGMHGLGGDWFRYGFLEKATFKLNKLSWIDYELSFSIVSERQPINNFFAAPDKSAPDSINQNLINAALAFQSTYSTVPKSMPQSIAGLLNDVIGGVARNVNLVTNFVGTVISTAADIKASASRALGLIKNARTNMAVFRRQLGALGLGFSTLSSSGNNHGQFADSYQNIQYIAEILAALGGLSLQLGQMQKQYERIAQTTPLSRYKVQSGDTLQRIAIKFYGSADNWESIYTHNKLQTTALVPGAILEIPKQ